MRAERLFRRVSLIVLVLSMLIPSCRKDNQDQEIKHFISKDLRTILRTNTINAFIDAISVIAPDAVNIKPLVTSDVNVYKVIYKSDIAGKETRLSGLVCVPTTPGEYPVLSFQNGTNTMNSNAPSESPVNSVFPLIESMAATGYIVVIADYPGFGESKDIPHPYLVAEPTVNSLVDLLYAVKEMDAKELPEVTVKNEYYVIGYSQGGWATLELDRALELDYNKDFNVAGACCGAGPYNISVLLRDMITAQTYPEPVYIAYILNAYKAYNQFTNPISDILKEPYASRVPNLFNGTNNFGQINAQLTTSIPGLITNEFITGFAGSPKFAPVREAVERNSISGWHTNVPLLMVHGSSDTQVFPVATETMYASMISEGSSTSVVKKVIIPGADHSDGVAPAMIMGFLFLNDLKNSR